MSKTRRKTNHGLRLQRLFLVAVFILYITVGFALAAKAQEEQKIIIAGIPANFPPHYFVQNNKPSGFAIEVIDEIAKAEGIKVSYRVFASWEEVIQAMREGSIDIIPNIGITAERNDYMDFTDPLESFDLVFFIRSTTTDIHGPEDLAARKVAAVRANAAIAILEKREDIDLIINDTLEEALIGLLASHVDALVYPAPVVMHTAYDTGLEQRIKKIYPPLQEVKRAIGVRKDRPELLKQLDGAVASYIRSPRYIEIYRKWYGTPVPFWNVNRVAYGMGASLLLVSLALLTWRYLSLRALNTKLLTLLKRYQLTKDALLESEALYRELIEGTDNIITRVDPEGKFLFLNPKASEVLGLSPEKYLGRSAFDFVHPEDRERTEKDFKNWLAEKKSFVIFENRQMSMNGDVRTILWTINLHYDANGQITTANSIGTDLTALREKEQELLERDEKIKTALRLTKTGVWSLDFRDQKIVWSDDIYRLLGYEPGSIEPSYKNWLARVHPDDRKLLEKSFNTSLARQNNIFTEYRILWPDSTVRWRRNIGWVYRDNKGNPESMYGVDLDITEHRLSQQKLAASQFQVKLLLDSSAEGIYGLDRDGNCTFVNRSCLDILGFSKESELLGKNMHTLIHHTKKNGTEYPKDECRILNFTYIEREGLHVDDEVMWRKDGTSFAAEYWSHPIMSDRKIVGAVVTFFDISERKKHEKELKNYRDHLEKIVEARTADLKKIINLMAGREVRMMELKKDITVLRKQLNGAGSTPDVTEIKT